jgi:hypothetical protein
VLCSRNQTGQSISKKVTERTKKYERGQHPPLFTGSTG